MKRKERKREREKGKRSQRRVYLYVFDIYNFCSKSEGEEGGRTGGRESKEVSTCERERPCEIQRERESTHPRARKGERCTRESERARGRERREEKKGRREGGRERERERTLDKRMQSHTQKIRPWCTERER